MNLLLDTPLSGPCTRKQAFNTNLIPEETRTYQPLPNKIMIDMIYRIAKESGVTLTNEQLGMDLKGQRFFGVMDIESFDFFGGKIGLQIGLCNSYNKSMSGRFCIGGKVFVCSNRAFHAYTDGATGISGMTIRPHKNLHSLGIEDGLIESIKAALGQISDFRDSQERFYDGLTSRKLRHDRAYGIIVRAAKAGIINKTKILTLAEEWDRQGKEPIDDKHEWHAEFMPRNAYSLFNAFTQVEKQRLSKNPVHSNISTMDLTSFFYKEFNLN